jgi:hypothetical protein
MLTHLMPCGDGALRRALVRGPAMCCHAAAPVKNEVRVLPQGLQLKFKKRLHGGKSHCHGYRTSEYSIL